MSLFSFSDNDNIINELREIDLTNMTPIDAINKLYQLQNKIKENL